MTIIKKLEKKLIKIGDTLVIQPMDGRKRTRVLNRTFIQVSVNSGVDDYLGPSLIKMRGLKESGEFEIHWKEEEGTSYYHLTSKGGPFLINGTLSYSCVLKSGDVVDLDYNRLVFLSATSSDAEDDEYAIKHWPEDSSFYIEGETGVGKTTMAKNLHERFVSSSHPFVAVNLSAFSESLIESELFGHEKGAFTGAIKEKRGAVELAKGGTLFIDEIDSLPLHLQVKLLTFLDDKTFRRVGGESLKSVKCRLVFASGRCLRNLVVEGRFRSDLYFRINSGMTYKIPPLRHDKERLLKLIENLAAEKGVTLEDELKRFYLDQPWPGNLRQVRSHFLRKCHANPTQKLLRLDDVDSQLLPLNSFLAHEPDLMPTLEQVKKDYCSQIFLKSQGSYELASKRLGIAVSTLRRVIAA